MQKDKLKIGMIVDSYYPKDIRVRKEAESLAKDFDVFVLCVKNSNEPIYETINNVKVFRLVEYKSFNHKAFYDIITSINFIHPIFKKKLSEFYSKTNVDVLHVHDLPLAKIVYQFSKKRGLKSVLDLHENYPEALKTWFIWRKNKLVRLKNKVFFNFMHWHKYEKKMINKFDYIIAVVEEMKERIINKHKIDPQKIIVVTNSEKKDFSNNFLKTDDNIINNYSDSFTISYVGGFGPHRGLQTAIEAIPKIQKTIPNVKLLLVGPANNDVKNHLKHLILKNDIENYVELIPSQTFESVAGIMKSSNINIIPHISNEHTESTIPHKLFQILLSGSPILVSDCAPLKRIIGDNDIGLVFKAGDSTDFANKIIQIYSNYSLFCNKAEKGKQFILNGDLNWEETEKILLNFYQNIYLKIY